MYYKIILYIYGIIHAFWNIGHGAASSLLRPNMLDVFRPSPLPRHRRRPPKPQRHRIQRIREGQRPLFWRRPISIADFASEDMGTPHGFLIGTWWENGVVKIVLRVCWVSEFVGPNKDRASSSPWPRAIDIASWEFVWFFPRYPLIN